MTESKFTEAKIIHDQMESIMEFVNKINAEDCTGIELHCSGSKVNISKGSQVFNTIRDFCDKALYQLNENFKKI